MNRRRLVAALGALPAIAAARAARAQDGRRGLPTIGFLGPPPSASGFVEAFRQGLADFGYVDGRNVRIAYRYTDVALQGDAERMARLCAELVAERPDVLVVSIVEAALAAKRATATIPIVMVSVADPVGAGLIASLARPGGNITGMSRQGPDLIGKQLQLLREVLPSMARLGVLLNPSEPLRPAIEQSLRGMAHALGLQATVLDPQAPAGLDAAFATLRRARVEALLVTGGGAYYLSRSRIAELALANRLPTMFQGRESVEAGGLMSYAASNAASYRRAGFFVDRILRGTPPAELPVEQPTKFELVVNLRTAAALGIAIPQAVLLRADAVLPR
jgi:putative ABC transport system substrate-binding protein